jgi:carbamoyl-phosphate synthase large subunit
MATGLALPTEGTVFISVCDADKPSVADVGRRLAEAGLKIVATGGTCDVLTAAGVEADRIPKMAEGRPNVADLITNEQVHLLINTPTRRGPTTDEGRIRALATLHQVPLITTLTAGRAAAEAIAALRAAGADDPQQSWTVRPLQEYFSED